MPMLSTKSDGKVKHVKQERESPPWKIIYPISYRMRLETRRSLTPFESNVLHFPRATMEKTFQRRRPRSLPRRRKKKRKISLLSTFINFSINIRLRMTFDGFNIFFINHFVGVLPSVIFCTLDAFH